MAHAILSPSAASRWLNCTPSARLESNYADKGSEAAKEGTLAHKVGELLIKEKLKLISKPVMLKELKKLEKDELYNNAMLDHAEDYAVFVVERFAEAKMQTKDALIFTERNIDLSAYVEEGFGTLDNTIIADRVIEIIDLKYGKGVFVDAKENKQMMLYALGALDEFDYVYDVDKVRMTIYQPRLDNYSSWEVSVQDLKAWGESELRPKAALAFAGKGEFIPGAHCQFCKVRATCKAHADMQLDLAKHDFKIPELLDEDEIADILDRAKSFENWLTAVEDHALHEAVNNGKKWPGYKLVEGRSNRKYSDQELVRIELMSAGYKAEEIFKMELLGITAMEKVLGKTEFNTLLSSLLIKPPGKPALVPESDKRPEYNSNEAAVKDFETIK